MVFKRVRTNGKVIWEVSYRRIPSGSWAHKVSGPDKKLAVIHEARLAIEYQKFLATGVYRPKGSMNIKQLVINWEEHLSLHASHRHVKISIQRLVEVLDSMPDADKNFLQATLDDLERSLKKIQAHRRLSARSRDEYGRTAKQFYEWLVDQALLQQNPFQRFRRIQVKGRDETFRRMSLSLDDVRRLAEVAGGGRAVLYWLAATTGLRLGELRALRWSDIRVLAPVPHINLPGFRNGVRCTKNGKDAVIPMQPWVAEMIHYPVEHPFDSIKDVRVFGKIQNAAKQIREDARAAGIIPQYGESFSQGRLDFHCLRRTTVRVLREAGVDDVSIKDVMRHSKYQTTLDHYHTPDLARLASQISVPDPRR